MSDVGDAIVASAGRDADEVVDAFWEAEVGRKVAMKEFRAALEGMTSSEGDQRVPLVIVVDELDRCRPDYALELLEVIKHFFSVPSVHFLLGVNLEALMNSVCARYGAGIDAQSYLKKFVSFSLTLPKDVGPYGGESVVREFASSLYRDMKLPDSLSSSLLDQMAVLARVHEFSMREVSRIASLAVLLPLEAKQGNLRAGEMIVLTTLLTLKVVNPAMYKDLLGGGIRSTNLREKFSITPELLDRTDAYTASHSQYCHDTDIFDKTWRFVLSNGRDSDEGNRETMNHVFGRFTAHTKIDGVPTSIASKYLEKFSFETGR